MPDAPSDPAPAGPLICIGLPQALARRLGGNRDVVSLRARDIAFARIDRMENALIACPLLGPEADALDILAALVRAGYRGEVVVVSPSLPDPAMVERELAQAAPGMSVALVVL